MHAELKQDPHAAQDKVATKSARERIFDAEPLNPRFPAIDVVALSDAGKLVYFRMAQTRFAPGRMPWIPAEQSLADKFHYVMRTLVDRSTAAVVSPEARKLLLRRTSSDRIPVDLAPIDPSIDERDERATGNYLRWLLWLAMMSS